MISKLNITTISFGSEAGKQLNNETNRLLDTYACKNESDRTINSFVESTDKFIASAQKSDNEDIDAGYNFERALKVCERVEKSMNARWGILMALKIKVQNFLES